MILGKQLLRNLSMFGLLCCMLSGYALAQSNFYEGKTVTLIATTSAGGTGDLRVKAMVPFLKKHIPGNPTVVIQYIDGGGGRKGTNYLYSNARPDGLTIGAASGAIIGLAVMGETGVSYDIDKFIYLGSPESENHYIIYTRKELGLDNLEKLASKPGLRIGAQTVGHVSYVAGRLFAYFLNLKEPKFIAGYTAHELDVALTQGELDSRANNASSVIRRNPDWVDKGLMNFHSIMEVPKGDKHPRLGHLPEIGSFAKNERETKLLTLWRAFRSVGSPYILPPGTPKERVATLEEAMRKTFKDPEFPPYFKKLVTDDASPMEAAELRKVVADMPRDAETIETLKKFAGPGPLPPR
ncbi:MAG: family tricarboxylate transporter, receptor protein [Deltaproteobacteria bacterium]|nr:family tricarboxylate transporter, receptor protein [Deltaproteobacteria bacterium]